MTFVMIFMCGCHSGMYILALMHTHYHYYGILVRTHVAGLGCNVSELRRPPNITMVLYPMNSHYTQLDVHSPFSSSYTLGCSQNFIYFIVCINVSISNLVKITRFSYLEQILLNIVHCKIC